MLCTSCFNAETRLHVFIERECNNCMVGDQIIKILVRATGSQGHFDLHCKSIDGEVLMF